MALGGKTSKKFYVTSGGGGDEINSTRKSALDAFNTADAAAGYKQLIDDNTLGPLIVNLQEMQDDIDELRRFIVSAAELKGAIGTLPVANGGTGLTSNFYPIRYATVTATTANMNALHLENPIVASQSGLELVAAPGSGLWINPISITAKIDRAAAQLNTRANLVVGWDRGGKKLEYVTHYVRRFGYGSTGDSVWNIGPSSSQISSSGPVYENKKLIVDGTELQAFTNNCFTDVKFHVAYQILPI
jgi:hypothetical protein